MPTYHSIPKTVLGKPHTVADELAFDALPDDTRALAERVLASRWKVSLDDAYNSGYDTGNAEARAGRLGL